MSNPAQSQALQEITSPHKLKGVGSLRTELDNAIESQRWQQRSIESLRFQLSGQRRENLALIAENQTLREIVVFAAREGGEACPECVHGWTIPQSCFDEEMRRDEIETLFVQDCLDGEYFTDECTADGCYDGYLISVPE